MLSVRIIPCLDVKEGRVVKGVQFRNHRDLGSIEEHAVFYRDQGADELVFYDITASSENRMLDKDWITRVSQLLDIPFCVAGGIRSVSDARTAFKAGADKISINSPALERPQLIRELAQEFGSQSIVVGIDSFKNEQDYEVYQYTGSIAKTQKTGRKTIEWVQEIQALGAGEIVLNCMNQDGVKKGYDLAQLKKVRELTHTPLIASGGAGSAQDFLDAFKETQVDGALAASIFHERELSIRDLKKFLAQQQIVVRL
ncbi:imidazole glycerol phosphate synthase subunit HisF [Legionella fairfieldensis]|uniref:imidazole glycerol phosphate synthase subunit HisF n=1 Tax=Legionella fairfieldensis TaxID=45064 RepID=UPI00048D5733|nr:imidazole glycerol phosphate synthase subunit HisF [Legionella fairfieldensis]